MSTSAEIAHFSMEIALDPALPTCSGGLGVLAGETIPRQRTSAFPWSA